MRKFLFNNPMLLLFLALVALSGCSKSKSGKDRSNNDQKAFRDSHFNVSKIPNQATWTAEESRCVDRARAESRPLEMCFANLNNSENINGRPSNTNGWPTNQEEKINGPFTKTDSSTCAHGETPAQHRDHQGKKNKCKRTGKNCNDESDVAGTVVSTDTPSGYHVHSAPAPQSYPAPVYQPPAQLQVQPQPRPQPRPQQPAAPPQYDYPPVASAPQPRPQPQPQRAPVVTAPLVPTTPTAQDNSGRAIVPNQTVINNAPPMVIERTPPDAQAYKVGPPAATKELRVVYENLGQVQLVASQDLINVVNSAFDHKLPIFNNARNLPASRIVDDNDYNVSALSTESAPIISNKLAFYLQADFPHEACDIHNNNAGPCLVIEKDEKNNMSASKYAVYFLGTDLRKIKHNARSPKVNGIIYYRKDLPTEQGYAARALSDPKNKNGFYLFSRLQPINQAPRFEEPIEQPVPRPNAPAVHPPAPAAPITSGAGIPTQTPNAGVSPVAPQTSTWQNPDDLPENFEWQRQQIETEANAAIDRKLALCKETGAYGGNRVKQGLAVDPVKRCHDPRDRVNEQRDITLNQSNGRGVVYACSLRGKFESKGGFIGFATSKINTGTGHIYCRPLNGGGPTQRIQIAFEENQGFSVGIDLGKSTHSLVATGFGWANGAEGLINIQKYNYPIQATVVLPLLGGLSATPVIIGSNSAQNQGPVFAFAASGVSPSIFNILRLTLKLNFLGNWTLGPQG